MIVKAVKIFLVIAISVILIRLIIAAIDSNFTAKVIYYRFFRPFMIDYDNIISTEAKDEGPVLLRNQ